MFAIFASLCESATTRRPAMPFTFDHHHLADCGFAGFLPLRSLPRRCHEVPDEPGIYVVTLDQPSPAFLERSAGGPFKRRDPSVATSRLAAKWVADTSTLYVGRASSLRGRLDLLARFGRGEPVAHWGGRYLWQFAALDDLLVCWRLEDEPVRAECQLLDEFQATMGRLPFANLVQGTRRAVAA
jgi:hypothetical protein